MVLECWLLVARPHTRPTPPSAQNTALATYVAALSAATHSFILVCVRKRLLKIPPTATRRVGPHAQQPYKVGPDFWKAKPQHQPMLHMRVFQGRGPHLSWPRPCWIDPGLYNSRDSCARAGAQRSVRVQTAGPAEHIANLEPQQRIFSGRRTRCGAKRDTSQGVGFGTLHGAILGCEGKLPGMVTGPHIIALAACSLGFSGVHNFPCATQVLSRPEVLSRHRTMQGRSNTARRSSRESEQKEQPTVHCLPREKSAPKSAPTQSSYVRGCRLTDRGVLL